MSCRLGSGVHPERSSAPGRGRRAPVGDGLAAAVVAALVGLAGVLVVRALAVSAPQIPVVAGLRTSAAAVVVCAGAAAAGLLATGVAHLLLVSTARPMVYVGWVVGLGTVIAAVLPLTAGLPRAVAVVSGATNLVIGVLIGGLVAGAVYAAGRGRA